MKFARATVRRASSMRATTSRAGAASTTTRATRMRARVVARAVMGRGSAAGAPREVGEGFFRAAAVATLARAGGEGARVDARDDARTISSSRASSAFAAAATMGARGRRTRAFASGGATDVDGGTRVDRRRDDVDLATGEESEQIEPCDARAHPEECVSRKGGNWGESSGRASAKPPARESIEGEVFRPRERLKTNADFDRVKRNGRSFNGAHVRIRAVGNEDYEPATCTRVGVVVPKKQLKRAVDRNLIKRRVRHIFRTNKDKWPPRVDFIVFVQKSALEGGFNGLRDDMFAWSEEYVERESQRGNGKDHKDAKRRRGEKFRDNE